MFQIKVSSKFKAEKKRFVTFVLLVLPVELKLVSSGMLLSALNFVFIRFGFLSELLEGI